MRSLHLPRTSTPLATLCLLGICCLLFGLMVFLQWFNQGEILFTFSPAFLQSLGGATKTGILSNGEWFRIFCAPVYHVSLMHLLSNCLGLYLCGEFLEPFIKSSWFLALFFVSAIGGVFLGIMFLSASTVSVGASGGVMGLMSAAVVISLRIQEPQLRSEIRYRLLGPFIATLLPVIPRIGAWILGYPVNPDGIDHAAHVGGALVGAFMGGAIVLAWPIFEPYPRHNALALVISLASGVLTLFAVFQGFKGLL